MGAPFDWGVIETELGDTMASIFTDADSATWEQLTLNYSPPIGTEFIAIKVRSVEDVFKDSEAPEFDGHYADAVSLIVKSACDLNADGLCDAGDIDLLSLLARENQFQTDLDLDNNQVLDGRDRTVWIQDLMKTYIGDSNLNGEFDSGDFVEVFMAGEYEDNVAMNSTWATGDWNGDGEFNTSDFVLAFQAGGYEQGPRAAVNVVPEPTSIVFLMTGLVGIAIRLRSARH